ncbi:hypothetical protein E2C01_022479 [Portunus trituberculatus]|uniref:Uncharacterized protein n=1 Tax=Portunus trituberculatus TaxID=210409 RepID=A0A5B7E7S8_PORTR|nr:hypothetical protein [Portunus trituberculatus]
MEAQGLALQNLTKPPARRATPHKYLQQHYSHEPTLGLAIGSGLTSGATLSGQYSRTLTQDKLKQASIF